MLSAAEEFNLSHQVTYSTTAACVWLIYDTIIHLDLEVECVWRSWAKWFYLFTRYGPIGHGIAVIVLMDFGIDWSEDSCSHWALAQIAMVEVFTIIVECLLIIRIYALYNLNKIILAFMIVGFAAEFAMMVVAMVVIRPGIVILPHSCLVVHAPPIFISYWLASLVFESFLFILTLFNFFRSVTRHHGATSVLYVFVRDGTWAFAMIFVVELLNTLCYRLNKSPLAGVGYSWSYSVLSFAAAHVILNLRLLGPEENTGMLTTCSPTAFQFDVSRVGPSVAFTDTSLDVASTYVRSDRSDAVPSGPQSADMIEEFQLEALPHDAPKKHPAQPVAALMV